MNNNISKSLKIYINERLNQLEFSKQNYNDLYTKESLQLLQTNQNDLINILRIINEKENNERL